MAGRPFSSHDPEKEPKRARARSKQRERVERNRPLFRRIIADWLNRPCVDCGHQFPAPAMQADHVRGKKYKISYFRYGHGSESALRAELAKCEVRCANCHVIRHALEDDRN